MFALFTALRSDSVKPLYCALMDSLSNSGSMSDFTFHCEGEDTFYMYELRHSMSSVAVWSFFPLQKHFFRTQLSPSSMCNL